jgi:hypothetical protein
MAAVYQGFDVRTYKDKLRKALVRYGLPKAIGVSRSWLRDPDFRVLNLLGVNAGRTAAYNARLNGSTFLVASTPGATVFGLIPLAMNGGPLWEGLCYTQIGGLTFATVITLFLVPVLYAIFVLDLKIVTWEESGASEAVPQG